MTEVRIVPAAPEHADALWDLLHATFRAGDSYAVDPLIGRDEALAYWRGGGRNVWLAETAGQPVGTCYLRANQPGPGNHVANAGFVTHPDARGKGVASAMLEHTLAAARVAGFRAMQFNFVVATNTGAIRLWEAAGFATVGRLPGAFRHPRQSFVDALVMFKVL